MSANKNWNKWIKQSVRLKAWLVGAPDLASRTSIILCLWHFHNLDISHHCQHSALSAVADEEEEEDS